MTVLRCRRCDVLWGSTSDMVPTDPTCWICGERTGEPPEVRRYDLCGVCRGLVTDVTRQWCSPSGKPHWRQIIDSWVERGETEARARSALAGVW